MQLNTQVNHGLMINRINADDILPDILCASAAAQTK